MNPKLLILLVFALSGLLLAGLSTPLILRWVKPNWYYGFRVPKTVNNPEIWYEINAYAGWRLLLAGIFSVALAAGLYFVPGLNVDAYALILAGVAVVALSVAIVQSFQRLSQM